MAAILLSRASSGPVTSTAPAPSAAGLSQFSHVWLRAANDGAWEEAVLLAQVQGLEWVVCEHDGGLALKELGVGVRLRPPATGSNSLLIRSLQAQAEDWEQLARDASLLADARRQQQQHSQLLQHAETWLQHAQPHPGQAVQLESLLEETAQRLSALEVGLGGLGGLLQHQANASGDRSVRSDAADISQAGPPEVTAKENSQNLTQGATSGTPWLENIQEASEEMSPQGLALQDSDMWAHGGEPSAVQALPAPDSPQRAPSDASVDTMELHRELEEACPSGDWRRDGIPDEDPLSTTASGGTGGSREVVARGAPVPPARVTKLPLHLVTAKLESAAAAQQAPGAFPASATEMHARQLQPGTNSSRGPYHAAETSQPGTARNLVAQWLAWAPGRAPSHSPIAQPRSELSHYGPPPAIGASIGSPPTPSMRGAASTAPPLIAEGKSWGSRPRVDGQEASRVDETDRGSQWIPTRHDLGRPTELPPQVLSSRHTQGHVSPMAPPPPNYPAAAPAAQSTIRSSGSFILPSSQQQIGVPPSSSYPGGMAVHPGSQQKCIQQQPIRHGAPIAKVSLVGTTVGQATPAPPSGPGSMSGYCHIEQAPLSARGEALSQRRRSSSPVAARRLQSVGPKTGLPCHTIPAHGLPTTASYTGHSPRLSTSPTPRVVVNRVAPAQQAMVPTVVDLTRGA
mmetsp:Transcript_22823/g.53336  ORF Transcript_22823/g.53336 Transcript_22823/m.53336 type:complete len:685 (-) Transcript_22823:30-2084(-)